VTRGTNDGSACRSSKSPDDDDDDDAVLTAVERAYRHEERVGDDSKPLESQRTDDDEQISANSSDDDRRHRQHLEGRDDQRMSAAGRRDGDGACRLVVRPTQVELVPVLVQRLVQPSHVAHLTQTATAHYLFHDDMTMIMNVTLIITIIIILLLLTITE